MKASITAITVISSLLALSACSYNPTADLTHAGAFDKVEYLEQYIAKGADVNEQDKSGDTALMNAVLFGNLSSVKYLITKGANVRLKNKSGETAMSNFGNSEKKGSEEILRLLLAKGANVNAKDKSGDTALSTAILFDREKNVQLLLKLGANIHIKNNDGDPTYYHACDASKPAAKRILKILAAKGAKCN